jgi:chromosome segregation ATPase
VDPTVIVLATAAGALIGTSVGILLLRRKLRPPITDGELAQLKGKLQTGESSLAAATANLEELRKQIALQETALRQSGEDLKKKQEQFDIESAETQREKGLRATAEQSLKELRAKFVLLTDQCANLEARVREAEVLVAGKAAQLVSADAELEAGKLKVLELTEQMTGLTSETAELKRFGEQETRLRTLLEAQLNAEQERIREMSVQVAELQSERLQLEVKLQEESRSAAKGMELLLMAQEKLSAVFKAFGADGQNGNHSPTPVGAAAAGPDAKAEVAEIAQATSAG